MEGRRGRGAAGRRQDGKGHCLLEMPTGTGKTVSLLSLILAYQAAHRDVGKLIYCTRTVQEMDKALKELQRLIEYRQRVLAGHVRADLARRALAGEARERGGRAAPAGLGAGGELCVQECVLPASPTHFLLLCGIFWAYHLRKDVTECH